MIVKDIRPGFWYQALDKDDPYNSSKAVQVKITRSQYILPEVGWSVVIQHGKGETAPFWNLDIEECYKYIGDRYLVFEGYKSLRKELEADIKFLEKEVHPKNWEVAQHIKYILDRILGD